MENIGCTNLGFLPEGVQFDRLPNSMQRAIEGAIVPAYQQLVREEVIDPWE